MCAYNAHLGQPACGSDLLLQTILRGYWNFQGYVTSDCGRRRLLAGQCASHIAGAAHAAADGLLHGTDTNCGATYQALTDAVPQGLVSESRY